MSHPSAFSPFQRHLLHYTTSPTSPRPLITILSATRASLSLGLNFPLSLFLAFALRLMYAPFPFTAPVDVAAIPHSNWRTQLEGVALDGQSDRSGAPGGAVRKGLTQHDLLHILSIQRADGPNRYATDATIVRYLKGKLDEGHVRAFYSITADGRGRVAIDDVRRFQQGEWQGAVVARRRGTADVLPFRRGGPLGVAAHSWAVGNLFGVEVYRSGKRA